MVRFFRLALIVALFIGSANVAWAKAENYTYQLSLVNNNLVDAASAGLAGKPVWYQWLYKVEVIPGGDTHTGLSHFDVILQDCYDQVLLAAMTQTIGFNSGNLYGLSGDKVRTYSIEPGIDGSLSVYGIKWNTTSSEQLDAIGEYDYFWFSAPTMASISGSGAVKFGSNALFLDVPTPACPECHESVIPEPTTMLLFSTGLIGAVIRRKKISV